ncbi:MAG: relaxase/mobilization nuclease domain-containing protein [Rhizobiaceae bacterium]|nr:relaxase/mobilization nuclease domain-containing protein [Rhizobiaceae bacterium]
MIVVVNPSSKAGHSFKGLHAYCSHDQQRAQTSERVDWISTRNLAVEDPDQAWKVMASTAYAQNQLKQANGIRAGKAPKDGAVMHVVMSFDGDEPTSPEEMQKAADELLAHLGADPAKMRAKNKPKRRQFADEHQVIMYAHSDTDNMHLHLMVNRIHPQTGMVLPTNNDHNKAQEWALKYSKLHGTDDKTPARAENDEMRKNGEYVKADKRKTRNAYEQDQKTREASNDNSRMKQVLEQQRKKDADLAKQGRELQDRKAQDLAKLIAEHKQRGLDLDKELQTNAYKAKATARELYRPLHRELKEEQAAEMKTFKALEKSFFGRAANSFNIVKASVQDIGSHRRGFNVKTFNSITSAAGRKEYMEQAQERARKALEREQEQKVLMDKEKLQSAHTAKMEENRLRLEAERAELKQQHLEEEQRLKEEWRARNEERENAIRSVPAPVEPKTDAKSKAQLILASKDYRAEFDKARQEPAPEQDNENITGEDSGEEGKGGLPLLTAKPQPIKTSFDEAQKERLEAQRKKEEAAQAEAARLESERLKAEAEEREEQTSARAAYIAEQEDNAPEDTQDRDAYIADQQNDVDETISDREAYIRQQQDDTPPPSNEPDPDPDPKR